MSILLSCIRKLINNLNKTKMKNSTQLESERKQIERIMNLNLDKKTESDLCYGVIAGTTTEMTINEVCNAIEDGSITFEDEMKYGFEAQDGSITPEDKQCDSCEELFSESELKQDPIYLGNGLYCQSCIDKHLETFENADDDEFEMDGNTGEWHRRCA